MFKITKSLELLIATQKEINKSIKDLRADLKPQWDKIAIDSNRISIINNQLSNIESNIYTKEETVKTINKEYNYRKEYEECEDENYALLELIEKYCKYDNKYRVIDLFKEINQKYKISRKH